VLNYEEDVGKYTIKVANDPRACNRVVSYRPKPNIISQHQLISLWEEKTGRSFKRVYVPEKDLVKLSQSKLQITVVFFPNPLYFSSIMIRSLHLSKLFAIPTPKFSLNDIGQICVLVPHLESIQERFADDATCFSCPLLSSATSGKHTRLHTSLRFRQGRSDELRDR